MNLLIPDHALFLLLAVALPVHGRWAYRRFVARVSKYPETRAFMYRQTAGFLWGVLVLLSALWIATGRAADLLGVRLPGGLGFWLGLGVSLGIAGFFAYQWRSTRRDPDVRKRVKKAMGDVAPLLPHSAKDRRSFSFLSMTAGIVEELAYRGFLVWYVGQIAGLWPAVLVSSLVFGLGHAYQGWAGIFKTAATGLVLGLLFVGTDSVWVPMLLHWAVDDLQGRMAFEAFQPTNGTSVESAA